MWSRNLQKVSKIRHRLGGTLNTPMKANSFKMNKDAQRLLLP